MKEVSDGRLYTSNDLVKADCGGCEGCSACCQGMGESIVLDPLDIHRLCCGLHTDFNGLMVDKIELQIVDSVILPNLKMASGNTEACSFLNPEGRCSIQCPKPNKTTVKIKKWLDTPDLKRYETYICDWHYYLRDLKTRIEAHPEQMKGIIMDVLQKFYLTSYDPTADFYTEFYERLKNAKKQLTL